MDNTLTLENLKAIDSAILKIGLDPTHKDFQKVGSILTDKFEISINNNDKKTQENLLKFFNDLGNGYNSFKEEDKQRLNILIVQSVLEKI